MVWTCAKVCSFIRAFNFFRAAPNYRMLNLKCGKFVHVNGRPIISSYLVWPLTLVRVTASHGIQGPRNVPASTIVRHWCLTDARTDETEPQHLPRRHSGARQKWFTCPRRAYLEIICHATANMCCDLSTYSIWRPLLHPLHRSGWRNHKLKIYGRFLVVRYKRSSALYSAYDLLVTVHTD